MALTEDHRRAQLRLRAATLSELLALWPMFDVNNAKETWGPFQTSLMLLIANRGRTSAGLASAYYRRLRNSQGVEGEAAARIVTPVRERVQVGLTHVLLNTLDQLKLKRPPSEVAKATLVNVSGEATRHVLNAGRQTIEVSIRADPQALGWQRITSSSACKFCKMLADRGPIYKSSRTARFQSHNHCACSAEPLFA